MIGGIYMFVINEFRIGGRVIKLGGGIFELSGEEYRCVGGEDKID